MLRTMLHPATRPGLWQTRSSILRHSAPYRVVTASATQEPELATAAGSMKLDTVLERVRGALGVGSTSLREEVVVRGTGTHLGIAVGWQLSMRPDGAFVEEIAGRQLKFRWGHDGGEHSNCWEVDDAGVPKQLELDDHEAMLLASYVRACHWLNPEIQSRLKLEVVPNSWAPATKEAGGAEEREHITMGMSLKDGKLRAMIQICTSTWRPYQVMLPISGDCEYWRYSTWQNYCADLTYPTQVDHVGASGGQHTYLTASVQLRGQSSFQPSYSLPATPLRPGDTHFIPGMPPTVSAWHSHSGHVLVTPKVNGKEIGCMILDTGASGFVIEKSAADNLGLEAFGELHVSGMAGKVHCQFRRADTIEIGPLVMQQPLFMEMMLGGVVRGAPLPVVGIIGYEVFRRAVIELPKPRTSNGDYEIWVHDPAEFQPWPELDERWETMTMVANLPHVKTEFVRSAGGPVHTGLFMLDSGAGGVDTMFHSRATQEYGLMDEKSNNFRFLKGVGGESMNSVKVQSGELAWMQLSGFKLDRVRSLFGGSGGLDLSLYTCGILCADLMARMHVVVDYARSRIAFLDGRPTPPSNNGTGPK